jgi:hypothetical protein
MATPISRCYEVAIPAKTWAAVGNPYLFAVGWQSILDSTGGNSSKLIGPYTYEDSAWVPPSRIDQLVPWRGYYVYNSADSVVTMRIPSLGYNPTGGMAKRAGEKSLSELELSVSSRYGRDYRNYFGFASGASNGYDRSYDFPKAGSPETDRAVVWFNRAGFAKTASRFQTDFTTPENGGAVWKATVGKLKKGVVYQCAIAGVEQLPDSLRCMLIDKHAGTTYEMMAGAYSFAPLEGETARELELVVGTEAFAKNYMAGLHLPPKALALSVRMREGAMIIHYALPWSARAVPVRLQIFDLRGRLAATLVNEHRTPGDFTAVWDSRRTGGASGMYLIRLVAGKQSLVTKGQLVR